MGAFDITIRKGEKEEKYRLYVEDYVMSYLKNYRTTDRKKIYFYGERNQKDRTYYIYGAGRQKDISYFDEYELLDEIICRYVMDMPVFSVIEESGTYELAGYSIFYQSNDAMQSYMIEQRKEAESEDAKPEINKRKTSVINDELSETVKPADNVKNRAVIHTKSQYKRKNQEKSGRNLMALQLSAILVVLAAIVINSTNSYTKLKDFGMEAIEVFFVMENQDALEENEEANENINEKSNEEADESVKTGTDDLNKDKTDKEETILRLEDLDAKFEEENMAAQSEGENDKSEQEDLNDESEDDEKETNEITSSEQAFSRNVTDYYRIEKGDTLYTISVKIYGDPSKVAEICTLNQISDPDHIESGQKILLP